MSRLIFLLLIGLSSGMFAGDAVTAANGKLSYSVGSLDSNTGKIIRGSFAIPVGDHIGFQADGLYTDLVCYSASGPMVQSTTGRIENSYRSELAQELLLLLLLLSVLSLRKPRLLKIKLLPKPKLPKIKLLPTQKLPLRPLKKEPLLKPRELPLTPLLPKLLLLKPKRGLNFAEL